MTEEEVSLIERSQQTLRSSVVLRLNGGLNVSRRRLVKTVSRTPRLTRFGRDERWWRVESVREMLVLLGDKCVNPVRLIRGERAMSLRYGCSRLRVLREGRDRRAASDSFASSSCGDCCWMNPERKRVLELYFDYPYEPRMLVLLKSRSLTQGIMVQINKMDRSSINVLGKDNVSSRRTCPERISTPMEVIFVSETLRFLLSITNTCYVLQRIIPESCGAQIKMLKLKFQMEVLETSK